VSFGAWRQARLETEDGKMAAKKSKSSKSRSGTTKAHKKPRDRKPKQLAEDTGLAQPDVLNSMSTSPRLPDSLDRQFDFWMTAVRMSAWPTVLHQQIRLARASLEFWLPRKPKQK
jgi:hypothetical protein